MLSNYWIARFMKIKADELQAVKTYERGLWYRNRSLMLALIKLLTRWLDKYNAHPQAADEEIAALIDRLTGKRLDTTIRQLNHEIAGKQQLQALLNNTDYVLKLARVNALNTFIQDSTQNVAKSEINRFTNYGEQLYSDTRLKVTYNYQAYQRQFNRTRNLSRDEVKRYLERGQYHYSDSIWRAYQQELPQQLLDVVYRGIIKGESNQKMIAELQKRFKDVNHKHIHRIILTSSAHIAGQATMDSYHELGVDRYVYEATLENHTCDICAALDGKVFLVSQAIEGANYPTMHPNCRCTTVPYYDGVNTNRERWYRNGSETGYVNGMNFEQWRSQYTD